MPDQPISFSCNKALLQKERIYAFLSKEAYWCKGLPREIFEVSLSNSICCGAYGPNGEQLAFARIITDRATFAYLSDVFVFPDHRGKGIAKQLMDFIMNLEEIATIRRFSLQTADAHSLYTKYGFTPLANPDRGMEHVVLNPYQAWQQEQETASP